MNSLPTIYLNEWSKALPSDLRYGPILNGFRVNRSDISLLEVLEKRTSLRFVELREGLSVSVGAHVGMVTLSNLRIIIRPKIEIARLMRMIAYAFQLDDLYVSVPFTHYDTGDSGLIDLLAVTLLSAVRRLARGSLLPDYQERCEELRTARGRIDIGYSATHPIYDRLRCIYDEFTFDHPINQLVAAGLRMAARLVVNSTLKIELARTAERFFGNLTQVVLDRDLLDLQMSQLNRRTSHYHSVLKLISIIYEGSFIADNFSSGRTPLSSFTLNMNVLYERFLGAYFIRNAPPGWSVISQETRDDVYHFVDKQCKWRVPRIRPDYLFKYRNQIVAVADAKYKDRYSFRPTTAELYQLTTYGMAYEMAYPSRVLMLYPMPTSVSRESRLLLFKGAREEIKIELVGVPLDRILDDIQYAWWPIEV